MTAAEKRILCADVLLEQCHGVCDYKCWGLSILFDMYVQCMCINLLD